MVGIDQGIHDTRVQPNIRPGDILQKVPCSHSLPGQVPSWFPTPFLGPCPLGATQQQTITAASGQKGPKMHAVQWATLSRGETDDMMFE